MAKIPSVRGTVRQAGGTHRRDFPTSDEPHGAYPRMQGPGKRLNVTGNHFYTLLTRLNARVFSLDRRRHGSTPEPSCLRVGRFFLGGMLIFVLKGPALQSLFFPHFHQNYMNFSSTVGRGWRRGRLAYDYPVVHSFVGESMRSVFEFIRMQARVVAMQARLRLDPRLQRSPRQERKSNEHGESRHGSGRFSPS
jgi:hypothetical protein